MSTGANQPLPNEAFNDQAVGHQQQIDQEDLENVRFSTVDEQLSDWRPDNDKGFLRGCIPTWYHNPVYASEKETKNPIKLLGMISPMGWLVFFSGWFAWTCDGYDFFAVPLTVDRLSAQFKVNTPKITTAITLTLLFRSLGALIFGVLADRFGRKWTLVCNLCLIAVFELGSGFCNTYSQFLAVRSLFGIAMGGIWGQAAAMSLENIPVQARGIASGILQQGYSAGYLLAAVINLGVVPKSKYTWRALYFFGAGFSLSAAILRACIPESRQYTLAREQARASGQTTAQKSKRFMKEVQSMLKTNWLRAIWAVCIMTGFNFFSHGSQDLYPKYLTTSKGLSSSLSTKATIISNCGAIVGGTIAGWASQYMGRRLAILVCLVYTAVWIPLWVLPDTFGGLAAGGFFIQSGVQGAWGIVPIYLGEVSPPAFRAAFAGLAYQLGNAASSGAAQIEADAGGSLTTIVKGKVVANYGTIQSILIGVVIAWMIVFTLLGPEAHGSRFEQAAVATQSGAGTAHTRDLVEGDHSEAKAQVYHAEQRDAEKAQAQAGAGVRAEGA